MGVPVSALRGLGLCLSAAGIALILYAATAFLLPGHPRQTPPSLSAAAAAPSVRIRVAAQRPRRTGKRPVAVAAPAPRRVAASTPAVRFAPTSVLPVGSATAPPPPRARRRPRGRTVERMTAMVGAPTASRTPELPEAPPPPAPPSAALP